MKATKRRNLVMMVMTLCMFVFVAVNLQAATYDSGKLSLSINNGMAVLTVDGNDTIQLTKALVTKDGGIDSSTGTVYLQWMSNSLYAYNYELQKGKPVELIFVDSGVLSIVANGAEITGYETSSGKKNLLTIDEIKTKLGISSDNNNGTPENTNSGDTGNTTNGGNTNSGDTGNTTNGGNTNSGDTGNTTNGGNTNSGDTGNTTNGGNTNSGSTGNTTNSGNTNSETTGNTTNSSNTNSKTKSNTSNSSKTDSKNTSQATKKEDHRKYVKYHHIITYKYDRALQDSRGSIVDRFSLKKNKVRYRGVSYKKIKTASFNKKGNLILITKKGKLVVVNHSNMKKKTIGKKVKSLNYDKFGIATHAVRKNKTRFSLEKY